MRNKDIKAVIFDCDGTLVNSEAPTASLITKLLTQSGYTASYEEILAISRGQKLSILANTLSKRFAGLDEALFINTYNTLILEKLRTDLIPDPNTVKVLEKLSLARCVASNGSRERTEIALEASGILQFFSGLVVSAYDINAWKPDPKIILHSATLLNTAPSECLVIDDSIDGLKAGLSAGTQVASFRVPEHKLGDLKHSLTQINDLTEIFRLI